jgi:uncharacterized protein (UPF0332 family)
MTSESAQFLRKADKLLLEAEVILKIGLEDAAGRTAYPAGFHAAQALISEKSGRTVKTHKGVHTEFQRLTKDDANFPSDLRGFLSRAYNLKAIADYQTGPGAEVSTEQATNALAEAKIFVAHVAHLLGER